MKGIVQLSLFFQLRLYFFGSFSVILVLVLWGHRNFNNTIILSLDLNNHLCKRFSSWHIFDPLIKVEPPSLCHLLQCALAEKNQTCRYCIWKSHLTTLQERGSPAHTWRFSSNGVSRACMQPYQLSDPLTHGWWWSGQNYSDDDQLSECVCSSNLVIYMLRGI